MSWTGLPAIIAAGLFLSSQAAFGASDLAGLKQQYETATKTADSGEDSPGFSITGTPQSTAALEREWTFVSDWMAASLTAKNIGDPKQVTALLNKLDSNYGAIVLKLDPVSYLIGVNRTEIGTFFIVRNVGGHFAPVWNVRQFAGPANAWLATSAADDCRAKKIRTTWDQCGPLFPSDFGMVPKSADGRSRFYVDAIYAQEAGETTGHQLSIWIWDGEKAVPQFAQSFSQMADVSTGTKMSGGVLHIQTKDDFANFSSCGACTGRQMDWSLRVSPDGIQNLGKKSLVPELDALDVLIGALHRGQPASALAAPQVIAELSPLIKAQESPPQPGHADDFSLGMLGIGSAEANPKAPRERLLCFSTDNDDAHRIFTLRPNGSGYFIAATRNLGDRDTSDGLCGRKPAF